MVRPPFFDENGLKKGAWSAEEDNKLRSYIQRFGHWNWTELPKYAGLARCGKSCRLRWINYLRPNVKHGSYTKQEEDLIIKHHHQFGNKWSKIAKSLPGRTDNEVKNYWHTHLKKRVLHQHTRTTKKRKPNLAKKSTSHNNSQVHSNDDNCISTHNFSQSNNLGLHILESYPLSLLSSSSTTNSSSNLDSETSSLSSFTDQFENIIGENIIGQTFEDEGSYNIDSTQRIWDSKGKGEVFDSCFWSEPFNLENCQQFDYEDDANSNFINGELYSSHNLSSYWEMVDFSCLSTLQVNMQCEDESEPYYW